MPEEVGKSKLVIPASDRNFMDAFLGVPEHPRRVDSASVIDGRHRSEGDMSGFVEIAVHTDVSSVGSVTRCTLSQQNERIRFNYWWGGSGGTLGLDKTWEGSTAEFSAICKEVLESPVHEDLCRVKLPNDITISYIDGADYNHETQYFDCELPAKFIRSMLDKITPRLT